VVIINNVYRSVTTSKTQLTFRKTAKGKPGLAIIGKPIIVNIRGSQQGKRPHTLENEMTWDGLLKKLCCRLLHVRVKNQDAVEYFKVKEFGWKASDEFFLLTRNF